MLYASGKPFVVENVEGSGHDLKPNLVLSGDDVGLPILRRRYFNVSFLRSRAAVNMSIDVQINDSPGANVRSCPASHLVVHGGSLTKAELVAAMGLDMSTRMLSKISMHHIEQGIPPAMTTKIIKLYTSQKFMIG